MASAKIKVKRQLNKDGTLSVGLQIIHGRTSYWKLLLHVYPGEWDSKKLRVRERGPHSVNQNQIIADRLKEAEDYLLNCQLKKRSPDPHAFLHGARVGQDLVSHLQAKMDAIDNPRTKEKYKTCITRVKEAGLNIALIDVNEDWIMRFARHLKSKGNNPNTRQKYISSVGSIFRQAKKAGLISVNPFEGRPKHSTPSKKAKLSLDEFRLIQSARFDGTMETVRRVFVFAVLARGMRAFDVLTLEWGNVRGDRLVYQAQKGPGGEGKWFDIEITEAMRECMGDVSTGYVFDLVKLPKKLYTRDRKTYLDHTESINAMANKTLKRIAAAVEIDKNITMHVARHTFAFIMDQSNVPLGTLQQLLGHGDMTTTKIYAESIRRSDDLDKVVKGKF